MTKYRWFCFKYNEVAPVLKESLDRGCKLVIIKNHGLALLSARGEVNENKERTNIAYAQGFNPAKDKGCDDELGDILGSDGFIHEIGFGADAYTEILRNKKDIHIKLTGTKIYFKYS